MRDIPATKKPKGSTMSRDPETPISSSRYRAVANTRPQSVPPPRSEHLSLRWAKVWAVEPERGDLYVVSVAEGTNQFVRLTHGGIVDKTEDVKNRPMQVLCNAEGTVVALPEEDTPEGPSYVWKPCQPMPAPSLHIFN